MKHRPSTPGRGGWRQPRRVFLCSTSDPFHEKVPDKWRDRIFATMALCPQHTFMVLTKRPERMFNWFMIQSLVGSSEQLLDATKGRWPLPNVWLGVSVEDQANADHRIPYLLRAPAARRFVSYEPALGPVNLHRISPPNDFGYASPWMDALRGELVGDDGVVEGAGGRRLDWIIAGGESGPRARPAHPAWFRQVRDDARAAGVPFFFKQWGIWHPCEMRDGVCYPMPGHGRFHSWRAPIYDPDAAAGWNWRRLGKRRAGRTLDGRTWDEIPE